MLTTYVSRGAYNEHLRATYELRYTYDPLCSRPQGGRACVTFEHLTDKKLFQHSFTSHLNVLTVKEAKQGPQKIDIERVQTNYCKFALGLSKYASSEACAGELGRLPLRNRVHSLAVRYWLRVEQGTPNTLLNATFDCAKLEFYPWMQDIRHLLYSNGLGYVWQDPASIRPKQFSNCLG